MKSSTWLIRNGVAADFARIADIERAAAQLFPAGRVPDPDGTLPVAELQAGITDGWLRVAHLNGQPEKKPDEKLDQRSNGLILGLSLCRAHTQNMLYLAEVSVHPDYGQRGIGRSLVEEVLDRAKAQGYQGVSLSTFKDLPYNGPFYTQLGFVELTTAQIYPQLADIIAAEREQGMSQRIAMLYRC